MRHYKFLLNPIIHMVLVVLFFYHIENFNDIFSSNMGFLLTFILISIINCISYIFFVPKNDPDYFKINIGFYVVAYIILTLLVAFVFTTVSNGVQGMIITLAIVVFFISITPLFIGNVLALVIIKIFKLK